MNLASPWSVQIAMLPIRRPMPDDIRSPQPHLRERGLAAASARSARAQEAVVDVLRAGRKAGMTADEIAGDGRKAGGNIYRHLSALADDGRVIKRKISKDIIRWRLTETMTKGKAE